MRLRTHDVWIPLRTRQHAVCLIIVLEAFPHRIPVQSAPGFHGNMMQQARRARSVPNLGRRNGSLPAANAFEPVAMLVIALIQVNLACPDYAIENLRIAGHQRLQRNRLAARVARGNFYIAGNKDPSFAPVELDAIGKVSTDVHCHAVRIDGMGEELAVDIP